MSQTQQCWTRFVQPFGVDYGLASHRRRSISNWGLRSCKYWEGAFKGSHTKLTRRLQAVSVGIEDHRARPAFWSGGILHAIPGHLHFKCRFAPQHRHSVPSPRNDGFGFIYIEEVLEFEYSNDLTSALKAWLLPSSPTCKRDAIH